MENREMVLYVKAKGCNAYIVANEHATVLVDTGKKGSIQMINDVLVNNHMKLTDIDYVFLTHTHYDHSGEVKTLKALTKAKIIVHKNEADYLSTGWTTCPKGTTRLTYGFSKIGWRFVSWIGKIDPVEGDIFVDGIMDLSLLGIDGYALSTPGHSEGSMCLVLNSGSAFVGDTMFNILSHTVYPRFADDLIGLKESWEQLSRLEINTFYPGHGRPFDKEKFHHSLDNFFNNVKFRNREFGN